MQSRVVINLQVEGIHAWPGVTETKYVNKVGYLQFPHRHTFEFKCEKSVSHADRDIEIIDLKHQVLIYLKQKYTDASRVNSTGIVHDFGTNSCEMIAEELVKHFKLERCEVLEDGENGAVVYEDRVEDFPPKYYFKAKEVPEDFRDNIIKKMEHRMVFGIEPPIDTRGKNVTFICSYLKGGKSTFSHLLAQGMDCRSPVANKIKVIEVSEIVKKLLNKSERSDLQGHPELSDQIYQEILRASMDYENVIVSGARQLTLLKAFPEATFIWIDTPNDVRYQRFRDDKSAKDPNSGEASFHKANLGDLDLGIADVKQYIFKRNGCL
jgi:hypothetical protein